MALTAGATAGALLFSTLYLQRTLGYPPLAVGAGFAPPEADHGLASGLVNTAQEVGSAMGLAVLASIAAASGGAVLVGYCWGYLAAAGLVATAALLATRLPRELGREPTPGEPKPSPRRRSGVSQQAGGRSSTDERRHRHVSARRVIATTASTY
jgi:hypothetical protein